jgi:hypothetical protein
VNIEATSDESRLVREVRYPPTTSLMQLLMYIRNKKGTGTLIIDLHQGGIGAIRFCEQTHLEFDSQK